MAGKRPVINSERPSDSSRFVTREELDHAIASLRETISSLQTKQPDSAGPLTDAPRPKIFHKKKEGRREKVATTIDSHLFELVKQRQQAGQQLSHILDSALWNYFGRPKLSFESDEKK
ncbi:MAG: hypothetical protein M0T73_10955 [Deltaproteobacteria bacterium]|nr:hypothetical protein [Deltaproteobacteria bacterium]